MVEEFEPGVVELFSLGKYTFDISMVHNYTMHDFMMLTLMCSSSGLYEPHIGTNFSQMPL